MLFGLVVRCPMEQPSGVVLSNLYDWRCHHAPVSGYVICLMNNNMSGARSRTAAVGPLRDQLLSQ
jgi:hypothetical protein